MRNTTPTDEFLLCSLKFLQFFFLLLGVGVGGFGTEVGIENVKARTVYTQPFKSFNLKIQMKIDRK